MANNRTCGSGNSRCTLCCKLVPVEEIDKPSNQRCRHQSRKGCAIYRQDSFPLGCGIWSCRWLVDDDTVAMSRPDRSHYVVDILSDVITTHSNEGEEDDEINKIEAVQVWCDPDYPDAWKDPALLDYLDRCGRERNAVALIRYSSANGFVLFPPSLTGGRWIEHHHGKVMPQRTMLEHITELEECFANRSTTVPPDQTR